MGSRGNKLVRVDRRYSNPYRLTGFAYRVIFKWLFLSLAWIAVMIASHNGLADLVVTVALGWYAAHRIRSYRHAFTSPQPQQGIYAPVGAPLGERNTRSIPQDVRIAVATRDGGRCRQCGSTQDLHFDHVIPWSRGGANTVANIQLLCGPCNRIKGAKY